jgi:outer membrane protein
MFMIKYFYSFLFLLMPLAIQAQQQTITLQEAIDTALENNYQLQQADNNLKLAETNIWSAKADFLPSINGSSNYNRTTGQQFDQTTVAFEDVTTNRIGGNINVNLTVFSGFRNILNLRSVSADEASQRNNRERLRETIIFDTASRFLRVALDVELLKIAEQTLEASQSLLEQISAQVEVGARPTVDLFNQESVVASDELAVIQSENALELSKTRLIRIMQVDQDVEYEFDIPSANELTLIPVDLELREMIDAALNNRNDLLAQEQVIKRNEHQIGITRANLYPTLSASYGINTNYNDNFRITAPDPNNPGGFIREAVGFNDQFFDQLVTKNIGMSLQVPIFNNWDNRTSLQSSKIALKNSKLELENVKFQIFEEVRQAYNDYISFSKELESTAKSLAAAERALETEQQRYNVGASTLIELNQANSSFVQAQSNRVQAVYNFVFQEKLLDYFIGRLDSSITLN